MKPEGQCPIFNPPKIKESRLFFQDEVGGLVEEMKVRVDALTERLLHGPHLDSKALTSIFVKSERLL